MSRLAFTLSLALVVGGAGWAALAQAPAAPAPAPPQHVVTLDPASAPAGTYSLDANHAAVVARIPHQGGYSMNVVRFALREGTLVWDPAKVEASKLTVSIDTTPKFDPITYGQDIRGPNFMNVAQFPTATFVSTAVRRTGPTTGVITGNLTLLGQTRPMTIEAEMMGAGKNARGQSVIGFSGTMKLRQADFNFRFMAPGPRQTIDVLVDGEFQTPPAAAG